ncbi:lipid-binding SYLF domain-containing protein [Deefgea salmonis]|uniref:Ysc84 actin-binding domain-containing protein n=1 Tax=Deefgea salmonis TaxID=2875502 RepID=A0ABS8BPL8_9NEIS|nr:YSC84-related protein [Deefgea salmonis]MCB5197436.1 hypothetical protein [Deefgea salmonis]
MRMKQIIFVSGLMLSSSILLAQTMDGPQGEPAAGQIQLTPAQQRAAIQKHTQATLSEVYKLYPDAQAQIAKAAGYAVFQTGGVQLVLLGAGAGDGMAVSGKKTVYMKMVLAKAGLGFGFKETRQVFVFSTAKAFQQFINKGWTGSAEATVAAKADETGKAISGARHLGKGVYFYQFTETGLTAEATVVGSKYYQDAALNSK